MRTERSRRPGGLMCQLCGGRTYVGLDLGSQPIGDAYLSREALRKPETHYPLYLRHCGDCGLAQLGHAPRKRADADGLETAGDAVRFLESIACKLPAHGVYEGEVLSWLEMARSGRFDAISHRRLRYFGLRPLMRLLARARMEIFDAQAGERLRFSACFAGTQAIRPAVAAMVAEEEQARLYTEDTSMAWARAAAERRLALRDRVLALARSGKKVIGYGAAAATVCNFCRLGPESIAYIADGDERVAGRYLPGVHIPIVTTEKMFSDPRPADAVVVFSGWFEAPPWGCELIRP